MDSKIKTIVLAVAVTALSTLSIKAQDATLWKIDKSHTSVNFSINHFFSAVTGKFSDFDGKIYFDPTNLNGSKADFTVAINSIDTDNSKRDKHLQSKDFFDANTYPKLSFKSTKFEKKSNKEYLMYGKLTIKNTSKDVVLPFKITGEMEHPMMKRTLILGVVIDTTIDRTDYEVGTGDWAATMVVGDKVKIHIPMELNRKK
ncbi:polyisoprenoid-binding protein [Aureibaculum marinum]|uniref:Polyisoprenoid-binding protein n=1 Tax=Aureibaculum marinum TaxID=2487930 RepID=A0A3N4NY56_9FLAO|nr:YceI family protein [Aureibaculum marinum]RPD99148.1 polyisoprenoid-binding protein [Aureibaculum marinum]